MTLEYIDALPRPWSTTLRAVGGLTALATAIAILYDTWRDARNSQRYLQAYADLMRKGLADVKGSYRVVPFEDEFVATCADHPFLSWSAPSAVEALHGLETLICETLADLATLEATGNAEEPQG